MRSSQPNRIKANATHDTCIRKQCIGTNSIRFQHNKKCKFNSTTHTYIYNITIHNQDNNRQTICVQNVFGRNQVRASETVTQ